MVKAIRGAIQVDEDAQDAIKTAVLKLYRKIVKKNSLREDMIVSLIISQTDDLQSANPATALREQGVSAFPFFCLQELKVNSQLPRTIRFLMHVEYSEKPEDIVHVYEDGAKVLRPDLC
jgi:chorismate mutase